MTTISQAQEQVLAFHLKQWVSETIQLGALPALTDKEHECLLNISAVLTVFSTMLEERFLHDQRMLRMHLALEELTEFIIAILNNDEQALLDSLADRLYVLLGDAATFDLPLAAAFDEVHKSNMTKERQKLDPSGERVRIKGPNYVPPDLRSILLVHRTMRKD